MSGEADVERVAEAIFANHAHCFVTATLVERIARTAIAALAAAPGAGTPRLEPEPCKAQGGMSGKLESVYEGDQPVTQQRYDKIWMDMLAANDRAEKAEHDLAGMHKCATAWEERATMAENAATAAMKKQRDEARAELDQLRKASGIVSKSQVRRIIESGEADGKAGREGET